MARPTETNPHHILWLQVSGIAGIQGAITLCWLIYNFYMPQLLVEIGFSQDFAIGLLIVENALAVVMEPLMGGLSDTAKGWTANRFPFISAGVILSSALFIVIPSIVTFFQPSEATRWIFLFVVVSWALAMTVFRSPAIALLGRCAAKPELPTATSFLTLVGGIISAFRPISNNFLLSLGAVFTFSFGSFVLLAAAYVLRFVNPPEKPAAPVETLNAPEQLLRALSLLFGTGFGIAWGSRLLMDVLGKLLKFELNTDNIDGMMFFISLSLAFAALPAGVFASKIGNRKAIVGAICAISILMMCMLFTGAKLPFVVIGVISFSLITNGAIPFALSLVSTPKAGLAIGTYFAGAALAAALLPKFFPELANLSPQEEVLISSVAFLLAGGCVAASRTIKQYGVGSRE
jgi:Major Facilitator Superfamily